MRRREFIVLLGAAASVRTVPAAAQPVKKIPLLAILSPASADSEYTAEGHQAFREGLRDLGYVEGETVAIVVRFADDKAERLPQLAAELVALKPDILITNTTPGVIAATQATGSIPIVVAAAGDLVESRLVASYARPGGNVTGSIFINAAEMDIKRFDVLKQILPRLSRVSYLVDAANPFTDYVPAKLAEPARVLGIEVERNEVRTVDEFEEAFARAARNGAGAVAVANAPLFVGYPERIATLAVQRRLPTISEQKRMARGGGLVAYGTNQRDMWRRAATYVDKILKGAKPADLPLERPSKIELAINLKTAKALDIPIPAPVLLRADEVIE